MPSTNQENTGSQTGFAILPAALIEIWPHLPHHHMRLLPIILSYAPNPTPGQQTLANRAGVTRQSVNDTVRQMREIGLLHVQHRTNDRGADTSCFYALTPEVEDEAGRQQIIARYAERAGTPVKSKGLHPPVKSRTLHPLSSLGVDTPCQVQDLTPPVKSRGLHEETREETKEETREETSLSSSAAGKTPPDSKAQVREPVARPTQTPPSSDQGQPPGFTSFWSAWPEGPRKAGRPQCLAHWRDNDLEPIAEKIAGAVQALKVSPNWTDKGGSFVPRPINWLREEGWTATPEAAPADDYSEKPKFERRRFTDAEYDDIMGIQQPARLAA